MSKLAEKYWSTVNNLDEKTRYYIFAGILIFIFLLDFLILGRPQINTLMEINPKINILRRDISETKDNIQRIDVFKRQVEELAKELDNLGARIKQKEEKQLIIEMISYLANKNKVRIEQMVPNSLNLEEITQSKGIVYSFLPISIEAKSSYHDFGRFLNEIERNDIFFTIGTFTIASGENNDSHFIRLTLKAIVAEDYVDEGGTN